MNIERFIYLIVQSIFIYLSFWLPFKCSRKDIGISASIVIIIFSIVDFVVEVGFFNTFIFIIFEILTLVFIIYWIFRFLKWNNIARIFVIVSFISFVGAIVYLLKLFN